MMQTGDFMSQSQASTYRPEESLVDSLYSSVRSPLTSDSFSSSHPVHKQRHEAALNISLHELESLPQSKLLTLCAEMEQIIQEDNAELVNELAIRDEQDYEKEVKNKFITLFVGIQDKRRKILNEKARRNPNYDSLTQSQLVAATIPYDKMQSPTVPMLEALNKILQAINDDSPQVPALLTDYILTVVCPSTMPK